MTDIPYRGIFAYDPTSGQLVTNGSGQIFDPADTGFATPLTVKSLAGVSTTTIKTTSIGMLDEFTVADKTQVNWKSGNFVVLLWSPAGMQASVDAANTAVQSALTTVQSLQAQVQALIQQGGSGGSSSFSGTLDDLPDGVTYKKVSSTLYTKLSNAPTTYVTLGTGATQAMPGNTTFTAAQVGAVASKSGTVSMWVRTAAQGMPSTTEGLADGDIILIPLSDG